MSDIETDFSGLENTQQIVPVLCQASRNHAVDPGELQWPKTLDMDEWFMSPEYISIYGTPTYENLTEAERKRLSFFEAVNFYSLNIHEEKLLIEGMAQRLYRRDAVTVTPYLHYFLEEENNHLTYFGGFCTRYHRIYPSRSIHVPRDYEPGEEDFLFFAKILIFEEIVDVYNVAMMKDDRLARIAREINRLHHKDEARHLAFGRCIIKELFAKASPQWSDKTKSQMNRYLLDYFESTWRKMYNASVYEDAELPGDPIDLRESAFVHPKARAHRWECSARCIRLLVSTGIISQPSEQDI